MYILYMYTVDMSIATVMSKVSVIVVGYKYSHTAAEKAGVSKLKCHTCFGAENDNFDNNFDN
jgi:hypothetical protein